MTDRTYKIAVIPGDGIGREVMPEGLRALDAVTARFGVRFDFVQIDWASRLLRAARQDDAGRLEGATVGHGRDPVRRGRLAGDGARSHFAAAEIPP